MDVSPEIRRPHIDRSTNDRLRAWLADPTDRPATVMGLGRHGGGLGITRYLARRGAQITVSDQASEVSLQASLAALGGLPLVAVRCGGHRSADIQAAELLVVNPAVRPDHPLLDVARSHRVLITSEVEIFLNVQPCRVVAVTGTNGKSTTAAMVARVLESAGQRVWLGGNLGGSLLDALDRMSADDWVVIELSSFQLSRLEQVPRPLDATIITGCTPNHLDWHGSFSAYAAAKRRLLALQGPQTITVLDRQDAQLRHWLPSVRGQAVAPWQEQDLPPLEIVGAHQRRNACRAAAACEAIGVERDVIEAALATFRGLPDRLQTIGHWAGRTFVNDTQSTTPESTIAALGSFTQPVWLLAGGADKGAGFASLADAIAARSRGVALYGATARQIAAFLDDMPTRLSWEIFATLDEAFAWCWQRSVPGDVLLLSPGCSSLDQYADCHQRGQHFRRLMEDFPSRKLESAADGAASPPSST